MKILIIQILFIFSLSANEGKFINPITDVCWECLFPITVSGVNVTPGKEDFTKYNTKICVCAGVPPRVGIPLTFWEPLRLVDVTRHAYRLVGLGGISIGKESIKNRGTVGTIDSTQMSFYQVHWYEYPIISLLELFTDFACLEKGKLDMAYMSELDPTWNDDRLAMVMHPEAAFFNNSLAQLACIADCTKATTSRPTDKLFWCAGCEGSLYPLTGNVAHHTGAIQASALLVHRLIAKMHRLGLVKGFEKSDFCQPRIMPIIKKSLYKMQLAYPIAQTNGPCPCLGKSDITWGAGKSFPYGGEDFVYLLWIKKQCCLDSLKALPVTNQ